MVLFYSDKLTSVTIVINKDDLFQQDCRRTLQDTVNGP